jgi:hypothetical protein
MVDVFLGEQQIPVKKRARVVWRARNARLNFALLRHVHVF